MSTRWSVESLVQCTLQLPNEISLQLMSEDTAAAASLTPRRSGTLLADLVQKDLIHEKCSVLQLIARVVRQSSLYSYLERLVRTHFATVDSDESCASYIRLCCQKLCAELFSEVTCCDQFVRMRDDLRTAASAASHRILSDYSAPFCDDVCGISEPSPTSTLQASPIDGTQLSELSYGRSESAAGDLSLDDFSLFEACGNRLAALTSCRQDSPALPGVHEENIAPFCDTLQTLVHLASIGLVSSEMWPTIKEPLLQCLLHVSDEVAALAVNLIWQLLYMSDSSTPQLIVQPYLCLLRAVDRVFSQTAVAGTDSCLNANSTTADWPSRRQLQLLSTVNIWQLRVTRKWLRAPSAVIQQLIDSTLETLWPEILSDVDNSSVMSRQMALLSSPCSVLCLLDPSAEWFSHWLCSQLSSRPLLAYLHHCPTLIHFSAGVVVRRWSSKRSENLLREDHQLALYTHSLHVLWQLCRFKEGRRFFPLRVPFLRNLAHLKISDDNSSPCDLSLWQFITTAVRQCCISDDRLLLKAMLSAVERSSSLDTVFCQSRTVLALLTRLVAVSGGEWKTHMSPLPALLQLLSVLARSTVSVHLWTGQYSAVERTSSAGAMPSATVIFAGESAFSRQTCLALAVFNLIPQLFSAESSHSEKVRPSAESATVVAYNDIVRHLCSMSCLAEILVISRGFQTCLRAIAASSEVTDISSPMFGCFGQLTACLLPYPYILCHLFSSYPTLVSRFLEWLGRCSDWDDRKQAIAIENLLISCYIGQCAVTSNSFCSRYVSILNRILQDDFTASDRRWIRILTAWAASPSGCLFLIRRGGYLREFLTSRICTVPSCQVFSDDGARCWLYHLAIVCCSHLDGRVLLLSSRCGDSATPSPETRHCSLSSDLLRSVRSEDKTSGVSVSACEVVDSTADSVSSLPCIVDVQPSIDPSSPVIDETSVLMSYLHECLQTLDSPLLSADCLQLLMLSEFTDTALSDVENKTSGAVASHRLTGVSLSTPPRSPQELARFLRDCRHDDRNAAWLAACKRVLCASFGASTAGSLLHDSRHVSRSRPSAVQTQLPELLDQLLQLPNSLLDRQLPQLSPEFAKLPAVHSKLAMHMDSVVRLVMRYASSYQLLSDTAENRRSLLSVLRHARRLCRDPLPSSSTLSINLHVDWLAVVLLMVYGGHVRRTNRCLSRLCTFSNSLFMWHALGVHRLRLSATAVATTSSSHITANTNTTTTNVAQETANSSVTAPSISPLVSSPTSSVRPGKLPPLKWQRAKNTADSDQLSPGSNGSMPIISSCNVDGSFAIGDIAISTSSSAFMASNCMSTSAISVSAITASITPNDDLIPSLLLRHIDMVLASELPSVQMALHSARLPLSCLCSSWLRQCYVGVLCWPQICHYMALVCVMGGDYSVYFTVSVIKFLQPVLISLCRHDKPLSHFYLTLGHHLRRFKVDDLRLSFMDRLCRRYRRIVYDDMSSLLKTYTVFLKKSNGH